MGQPQFSQIVASAARESIVVQNLNSSTNVPISTSEIIDVFAPAGTICQLNMLFFLVSNPAGATTGTHEAAFYTTNATLGTFLFGRSLATSNINFDFQDWQLADSQKNPPSNGATYVQNIRFDSSVGLRMRYSNNTNAAQANTRQFGISYTKRVVG